VEYFATWNFRAYGLKVGSNFDEYLYVASLVCGCTHIFLGMTIQNLKERKFSFILALKTFIILMCYQPCITNNFRAISLAQLHSNFRAENE
jgi:hypothetical protein